MEANILTVPATRGKMGTSEFYTANFPMGMVVRLFQFDPEGMPELKPEDRLQREIKKRRIPEIANYITDNDDYLFSSITVSVDTENLMFVPSEIHPDVGLLKLPMDAAWIINDGQHRVAGIAEALRVEPSLRKDTLSVVILPDGGLERSQQIFSDLNRTVQKTSKSLDILFDRRAPINRITNECVEAVGLFKGRINKERVSLAVRSADFATLSAVQAANVQLIGNLQREIPEAEYDTKVKLATGFWELMTEIIEPWAAIANESRRPAEVRGEFVSSYALALWAVGNAGQAAMSEFSDWKSRMRVLANVDWRKSNQEWQGICMTGLEVVTRGPTRTATAAYLRWKLDIGPKPEAVL